MSRGNYGYKLMNKRVIVVAGGWSAHGCLGADAVGLDGFSSFGRASLLVLAFEIKIRCV